MYHELIKVEHYSFLINRVPVLPDVWPRVHDGEYLSILGPNGAGKTTLLKCLMRIYTGGEGEISLAGKTLDSYHQKELARLMSYVPQSNGRSLDFTVYEFVMMGRYPYFSPFSSFSKEDKRAVTEALAATGTEQLRDRYINTLSGGESQNVFIAAALAQGSRILLLDEPTTFLDHRHQSDIHTILKRINREFGITIVSVTHNINNAIMLSNRVVILKEGAVAFSGSPMQVMNNEVLERVYDTPFLFVNHPETGQPVIVPGSIVT